MGPCHGILGISTWEDDLDWFVIRQRVFIGAVTPEFDLRLPLKDNVTYPENTFGLMTLLGRDLLVYSDQDGYSKKEGPEAAGRGILMHFMMPIPPTIFGWGGILGLPEPFFIKALRAEPQLFQHNRTSDLGPGRHRLTRLE